MMAIDEDTTPALLVYRKVFSLDVYIERLIPLTDVSIHHSSGFNDPSLLIYTDEDPNFPTVSTWGLIPSNTHDKNAIWNKTLNARGETIFKLPSFRESAKKRRCLIHVDGFYEHHHYGGQTYPFYIHRKDDQPITLAGLWSIWEDRENGGTWNTFAIVTTEGNSQMAKIHNNPKLAGPRMPLILPPEVAEEWITPYDEQLWEKGQKKELQELIKPFAAELDAHTVARLRGKEAYIINLFLIPLPPLPEYRLCFPKSYLIKVSLYRLGLKIIGPQPKHLPFGTFSNIR